MIPVPTWPARFPDALEREFQRELAEHKRRTTREGGLLAIALFAVFAIVDRWAVPGALDWVLFIRFGLVIPMLGIIVWLTGRPGFPRAYTLLMAVMFMGMGLAIEVMVWLAAPGELARMTYYSGLILVVVALHAWTYLGPLVTGAIGFSLVALYLVIALFLHAPGDSQALELVFINLFFFVSANLIGLYGVQARERTLRDNFLLRRSLHDARAEAERLAQAKGEFLANMSHEIRTPLHGILGLAHLGARDADATARSRRNCERILDSGQLLQRVLNDILDCSRLEAGRLAIESVPMQPGAVAGAVLDLLRESAETQGLVLELRLGAELPDWCLGDPLRLRQVLLNLVGNAIKFTPAGRVGLTLAREGGMLVFQVSDTGIGMTSEQMARLFVPFEQGDGSIARRFGGSGLGLSIARHLVALMEGEIRVESQPGVGSRFEVRLPHRPAAAPDTVPIPVPDPVLPRQSLAGLRILVAEDDPVNQAIVAELLTQEGATAVLTDNGQAALDRLRQDGPETFAIVLMDLMMPVMDGYTATRDILALDPGLPILGQSAHAFGAERDRCFRIGMVDYLAKPLDPDELIRLVRRHARHQSPARA